MGYCVESDKSTYKVAAGASIKARDQVYMNATGFAAAAPAPGTGISGLVMGSAIEDVDNTSGSDGDLTVTVEHSQASKAFLLAASGIVETDAGKTCYVGANPKTVSLTSTNAVKSGTIQGVEPDGRVRVIFTL